MKKRSSLFSEKLIIYTKARQNIMLTTIQAQKILNIPKHSPSTPSQEIENAYLKMMRRYPPEVFPQKATVIRKAYDVLMLTDEYVHELLNKVEFAIEGNSSGNNGNNGSNENDLSFLKPYFKKIKVENE